MTEKRTRGKENRKKRVNEEKKLKTEGRKGRKQVNPGKKE